MLKQLELNTTIITFFVIFSHENGGALFDKLAPKV